jgi:hypothetical protein
MVEKDKKVEGLAAVLADGLSSIDASALGLPRFDRLRTDILEDLPVTLTTERELFKSCRRLSLRM